MKPIWNTMTSFNRYLATIIPVIIGICVPCRDGPRSDFVAALGLDAITYAPGIKVEKRAPSDWSRAATLNRVLRRLYPDENYGEGEAVASAYS